MTDEREVKVTTGTWGGVNIVRPGVCIDIKKLIDNAKEIAARQKLEDYFMYNLNDPKEEVLCGAIKTEES